MILYSSYSDQELLSLTKQGDEDAFKAIYERHWERMSNYAIKVLRNESEAQDILQEIFISLWKRREVLAIEGELTAYLLKSVRNLAIRYIEKNLNKAYFFDSMKEHYEHFQGVMTNELELKELEILINNCIKSMPPKMQEVFRLSRYENLTYKEIAESLGIASTTVKKQISNAIKVIKKDLDNNHYENILFFIVILLDAKK